MIVQYQALNKTGNLIAESIEVDEISQVYSELGRRGLTPVKIVEAKKSAADGKGWWQNLRKQMFPHFLCFRFSHVFGSVLLCLFIRFVSRPGG